MTTNRRAAADVVAAVRRSIVGVRARTARGTGWVALANDLIVTSQTAVGYELDVQVELEGGARHAARVIWADVPRDLRRRPAAGQERLSLPPLVMRPDLPRIAEPCYLLGAQPGQPFRITPTIVSAVDFRVGATRCFEIDAGLASPGAPVVDGDGHIIGVSGLDLPRGDRVVRAKAIALPVAALQRALSVFDVPPPQLASRMPTYRCPACAEPYGFELARCAACGRTLPHAWDAEPDVAVGERLVRDVLKAPLRAADDRAQGAAHVRCRHPARHRRRGDGRTSRSRSISTARRSARPCRSRVSRARTSRRSFASCSR